MGVWWLYYKLNLEIFTMTSKKLGERARNAVVAERRKTDLDVEFEGTNV